jgi:cytochrome b subunit of formate dehydrogenase
MAEIYAWVIVAVAGLAALAGVFLLTRPIEHAFLKTLLRCLAAVWLLLPWQIGVVEGKYAPAFIVAIFEGLFRREGNPWPALSALAVGSLAVLVVLLVAEVVKRARAP